MKKIVILLLLAGVVLSFSACTVKTEKYIDEEGNVKEFTYVTRETSDKFVLFEEALLEKGIVFEVESKAEGIIDGAIEGRKYSLETGKVFEIFKFDVKSEAYKEAAKTSKICVGNLEVEAYISVAINDEYALLPANYEEIKALFLSLE